MKYQALRFGIPVPKYRKVKWPEFPKYQAVGRWEGEDFDPELWRNDYPNPAFQRATARDVFWAAKILMTFSKEELLAMVETGEYSDPDNTDYFHEVLVQRQMKCGRWGIQLLNPLDQFELKNSLLHFENLSEKYGFTVPGTTQYEVKWSVYDNQRQHNLTRGPKVTGQKPAIELLWQDMPPVKTNLLLLAEVRSFHKQFPHWEDPIKVYFRSNRNGYELVGIERESPARPIGMK
jgi:hypothetical protein